MFVVPLLWCLAKAKLQRAKWRMNRVQGLDDLKALSKIIKETGWTTWQKTNFRALQWSCFVLKSSQKEIISSDFIQVFILDSYCSHKLFSLSCSHPQHHITWSCAAAGTIYMWWWLYESYEELTNRPLAPTAPDSVQAYIPHDRFLPGNSRLIQFEEMKDSDKEHGDMKSLKLNRPWIHFST